MKRLAAGVRAVMVICPGLAAGLVARFASTARASVGDRTGSVACVKFSSACFRIRGKWSIVQCTMKPGSAVFP